MGVLLSSRHSSTISSPFKAFVVAVACLIGTAAHAEVLYDQMSGYSSTIIPSSWYAPDGADGDTYAYDNFLVPYKSDIQEVWWVGNGTAITGVTVRFYIGLPGAPDLQPKITALPESEKSTDYLKGYRFSFANVNQTPLGNGLHQYHVVLPQSLRIAGGQVYWVKVEGDCVYGASWGLAQATHGRDASHFRFITGSVFQKITGSLSFQLRGKSLFPIPLAQG